MAKPKSVAALIELRQYFEKIDHLERAHGLLYWDRQTHMPDEGNPARASHEATLSGVIHELLAAPVLGRLISKANVATQHGRDVERAYVREARREYRMATKLPAELVMDFARTSGVADQAWKKAKAAADFETFAPHLKKLATLSRRMADCLGYRNHPYDALLDLYEPGVTTAQLDPWFDDLRTELVPLLRAIRRSDRSDREKPLKGRFGQKDQLEFNERIVADLGYDFGRGRLDLSEHPFSISFSPDDARITTRPEETNLTFGLTSTIHEAGHAMYEQGIDPKLGAPLAGGVSVAMHESQSRLWENLVGRSRPFWKRYIPLLHEYFPSTKRYGVDDCYRAINAVRPMPIRVEADEVSYNLHILLRYEIERSLVEGSIAVSDLPEVWNAKMKEYLDITVKNDAEGVLQDVHWTTGFGYFPTYTLGTVISVQLLDAAKRDDPRLQTEMTRGRYGRLLTWLRRNVHRHGSVYPASELLKKATGNDLTTGPYLAYLKSKYGKLYDL